MIELTVELVPENPEFLANLRELSHMSGSTGAALSGHPSLHIQECYLGLECTGSVVVGCSSCAAMHLFLTLLQVFDQPKKSIGNVTMPAFSSECPTPRETWDPCRKCSCSHLGVTVWWLWEGTGNDTAPAGSCFFNWQSHMAEVPHWVGIIGIFESMGFAMYGQK